MQTQATSHNELNQGLRRHKLMTTELRQTIPALYEQDGLGMDAVVHCKFFCPYSQWTCYVTEFDGQDTLFGWTTLDGMTGELGYGSLGELLSATRGRLPMIERDRGFGGMTIAEAIGR